jgi:ABC-type branched-subunit amino acid transport system substrate-binding protein
MKTRILRSAAQASIGIACLSLACSSWAQSAAPGATVDGDTIVLGQTAAQSGPQAPIGASKWGLEAFIAYVNAKGGVAGK